jgi:hypothetical protein
MVFDGGPLYDEGPTSVSEYMSEQVRSTEY